MLTVDVGSMYKTFVLDAHTNVAVTYITLVDCYVENHISSQQSSPFP